VLLLLTPIHV